LDLSFSTKQAVLGGVGIFAGSAGGSTTSGGSGGSIERVKLTDPAATEYQVLAGEGGTSSGRGGAGGGISQVNFAAPNAGFIFRAGNGGLGSGDGGAGGAVEKLSGFGGIIKINAGYGGDSPASRGGNGGSVRDLSLSASTFVREIIAGGGGDGDIAGGDGGDVLRVRVNGDIGNFGIAALVDSISLNGVLATGGGGTGAAAGNAGRIETVSARRISNILAVNFLSATQFSAVRAIAGVVAEQIGSDLDGDGAFDFTDTGAPGFLPGSGDASDDGFVFVKASGVTAGSFSTEPLRLLSVV
jgi:hypothetical protein